MGRAIGQSLPLAVGVALSPLPIIAVVIMLTTARGGRNGWAFLAGWLAGLAVAGTVVLVIGGALDVRPAGKPQAWASWVDIGLGVLLILVGVREFRSRPRGDDTPRMPRWMARVDQVGPAAASGAGAALVAVNPKNLLLVVGGAAAIAQTGIAGGQQVISYVVFSAVASVGVGAPVVIHAALGEASAERLAKLKTWMSRENAVILAVLCVLIAAKLIGGAIGALAG